MIHHVLASVVAFAAAPADPATAEDYGALADRQFAGGAFAEASASFAMAFGLDQDPVYLYGWAQSERRAGNCPRALELYRQYAAMDVSAAGIEAARKNALRCGGTLQPVPVTPQADDPAPGQGGDDGATHDASTSWRLDAPAISLLATGGAIGIVGVVLGVGSAQQARLAQRAPVEASYATRIDRSVHLRTAAIVCASLSGIAIVAGLARYVVVARRPRPASLTWVPGRGLRF